MWWPDTSEGDRALRDARKRFAGRDVYGFGGIGVECGNLSTGYDVGKALHVRDVVRDTGRFDELGTGSTNHSHDPWNPHFFAYEPLRLLVDMRAGNVCPALILADWQLDTAITTASPPPLPKLPANHPQLRKGMSRSEVAWRFGYPPGFAGLAELNRAQVWSYEGGAYLNFAVRFRDDRVASFTMPQTMP
jgi:hypothetical protein